MPVYTNPTIDQEVSPKQIFYVDNKCAIFTCNGSPEGVILANTGSIALSDNGSVFKKTTDDLATGWVELASGTVSSPLNVSGTNPTINLIDTDGGDDDGVISMQSDVMSIGVSGGILLQIRSNGQILNHYRRILLNTASVGNVGAGLDTLHSFNLPANSLAANNDELEIWYSGSFASNDNDKLLALSFGGTTFINTGAVDVDAGAWTIMARIIRLTNTSIRCIATINMGYHGATSANVAVGGAVGGIQFSQMSDIAVADLASNVTVLSVLATGVADNDIVQNLSIIKLLQQ